MIRKGKYKLLNLDGQYVSTNCSKRRHGQCAGSFGSCECGCHEVAQ